MCSHGAAAASRRWWSIKVDSDAGLDRDTGREAERQRDRETERERERQRDAGRKRERERERDSEASIRRRVCQRGVNTSTAGL